MENKKRFIFVLILFVVVLLVFILGFYLISSTRLIEQEAFCSAFIKMDNSFCDAYGDNVLVSTCKDSTFAMSGLFTANTSYCALILDLDMKNICFAFVENNVSHCNLLLEDSSLCVTMLAGQKPQIEGKILGNNFYYWFNAAKNQDKNSCLSLKSRDSCKCLALLGEENLCNEDKCDNLIFKNADSVEYCSEILNEDLKAKCIANL